jgi:putative aldouronate transport system permease protein
MYFSGGLVPFYILMRFLGIIDTVWVLILPGALVVWNVIIFRTFFQGIPASLRESAIIDGANDIHILFRIILPLSKPVLAAIALFTAVAKWNDFMTPFIFMKTNEKYPLAVILRSLIVLRDEFSLRKVLEEEKRISEDSLRCATIIVTILPIVMVYPFLQKYFIKGIMIGSLKG